MKTFEQYLVEKNATYSFGCVMLDIDPENNLYSQLTVPFIRILQQQIPDEELYNDPTNPDRFGKEQDLHTTVLYGLHPEVTEEDVKNYTKNWKPVNLMLTGISIFENGHKGYDVVKLDVESSDLNKYNEDMKKLPFTSDYPDYKPHITLAYVLPGNGKKYELKFDQPLKLEGIADITYSYADKTKEKSKIKLAFRANLQ